MVEDTRYRAMTQHTWTEVVDDPAARHLVVARVQPKSIDQPNVLLAALIERLGPVGEFALLTRCEEDCAVVLCAFSHPEDAQSLAYAVEAEAIDRYPEWASQRGFTLDRAVAQAVIDALEASALEQAALTGRPQPATPPA
ncbi:MAG: hypothetical protein JSS04_02970 [Proteobacteria bacterium]|nr:hypothetical protein [Pseudomonadota bacterium]